MENVWIGWLITAIGFLGLVIGFIMLAVLCWRTQRLTRSNTEAILCIQKTIQSMGDTHHKVEQDTCSRFDQRLRDSAVAAEAKFEYVKAEQARMKAEIIGAITTNFKEFSDTFGKRLTRLEYEVDKIKEIVKQ